MLERIAQAEKRAGRTAGSVALIAVSKTKTFDAVTAAALNGARHFGENYVQEALKKIEKMAAMKWPEAKSSSFSTAVKWHFIGALQTNKTKLVVGKFATIQSVDRVELARALDARAKEADVIQSILVQVKLGDEPAKGGVAPGQAPELLEQITELKNLKIDGLMSLPPIETDPELSRKFFRQLAELRKEWAKYVAPESGSFAELSMGTTHDFEVAVEEGATMVRVGTAIFGSREKPAGH